MKTNKKVIYSILFILLFQFSGCLSTNDLTTIVKTRLENEQTLVKRKNSDFLVLKTDALPTSDSLVTIKKDKSYVVPLIFFWAWNKTISCQINSTYFSNTFSYILEEKAAEFQLNKHLGNKKIEIAIEQVPSNFTFTNNGSVLFAVFFYIHNFHEEVLNENQKFIIKYRLTDQGKELRKGILEYNFESKSNNRSLDSYVFLDNYVNELVADFEAKSSEFVEKIIEDL